MALDPRLVGALDALAPTSYTGEAYRHVAENRHPLSGAGARSQGGRWNPPQSFATLYLAVERETVEAEFARMAARQGLPLTAFLPRRMYRYEVKLSAVVDLRQPSARQALDLSDDQLSADDLRACQAIGEAAQYLGREAILAPSATGAGTVLAIFFDRLQPGSVVRDIDFVRWETSGR